MTVIIIISYASTDDGLQRVLSEYICHSKEFNSRFFTNSKQKKHNKLINYQFSYVNQIYDSHHTPTKTPTT